MAKGRRNYTAEQKVSILKEHLVEGKPLSDLCDAYDLHPTVFYRWQKEFFEKGARAFEKEVEGRTKKLEHKIAKLEKKLTQKNEVLSELMEEHVALKKTLGEVSVERG
ncbi:MAG: transposase, partial [Deltaproteobacteria bacterium]|nr:transposase [Deltaproteobacteria bacterium]